MPALFDKKVISCFDVFNIVTEIELVTKYVY